METWRCLGEGKSLWAYACSTQGTVRVDGYDQKYSPDLGPLFLPLPLAFAMVQILYTGMAERDLSRNRTDGTA